MTQYETMNNPVIFVGNDGILHMLFSCDVAKKGIFYTKSEDDGLTWATPKNISDQFSLYFHKLQSDDIYKINARFLNAPGDMPICFSKNLMKYPTLSKPHLAATSETE